MMAQSRAGSKAWEKPTQTKWCLGSLDSYKLQKGTAGVFGGW